MITYVGVSLPMGGDMSDVMKDYTYAAFELLIGNRTPEGYLATVVESPAGEGEALCVLHVDEELQDVLRIVEQGVVDEHYLAEFGAFLFSKLFTGDVASLYRTSLGMIRSQAKRLRIRLRIMPPELAALPWEYLLDLQEQSFLAISPETALVRYVPITLPVRPTTISPPLRVLVVIASPHDLQPLDVAHEKAILLEALDEWVEQGRIQVEVLERATAAEISQAMRRFQPHVFHFVGHGLFENETAYVVLEDESNNASLVDERTFREFFSGCQETRLAVLNACQSATLSTSQPLVGLAPRLLQRQLSAVVAMQHPVSDKAASIFTREFYRSLALGLPVDAAISEARKGIFLELGVQSPNWGTPVLFLRARDGLLFQMAETVAQPLEIPPPPELVRPPEIPDFVGREAELAYYAEKVADTHLAVIAGMAGVGKTALAAKLTERVAHDRDRVFWHSFHEGEGIDAIQWRLAGFLARHGRDDLWRLLQSTRITGGKPPPSETLFDYVLQLVSGSGFLFCFDDFHHVDEDPVLNQLVERLRSALVAGELSIILTSRRVPDFVTLAQFDPLEGLSYEDTRHLLNARNLALAEPQIEQLYHYTAGNAEFLTLAIDALQRAVSPDLLIRRLAESDDIERYLLQEVDEVLTGPERGVMNAVAVLLGYGGTRNAIEAVLNGGNSFRMLRRLTERHLLIVRDGEKGREYGQHAIVQAFYYEQTSVRERRAMHRRAGEYYRTTEPDWLRAGVHFERAGEYEQAVQLATNDVWAVINQGQARALSTLLERFQPEQVDSPLWVEVNLARGQVYSMLGENGPAKQSYQEALAQLSTLPAGSAAATLYARICHGMGELLQLEAPQEALAWLQRGLADAPQDSPLETAALHIRYGYIQMMLGNYEQAQGAVENGLKLLPPGPSQLRVFGLAQLGSIYSNQGHTRRSMEFTVQALTISRQLHDNFWIVGLLINLAIDKLYIGEWQEALDNFQQGLALAERLGSHKLRAFLEANLGELEMLKGNFEEAERHLQSGLDLARQTSNRMLELYVHRCLAELHLRLEHWDVVAAELDGADSMALAMGANRDLIHVHILRAEIALAAQQTEEALGRINQAIKLAQGLGEEILLGLSFRSLGRIYLSLGHKDEALNALEQSLACLDQQDSYQAARTKVQLGSALVMGQDNRRGTTLLEEAQLVFQRLEAQYDLRTVQSVVAKLLSSVENRSPG
jgi:tetratricopeptide (TPR) repeat protein